MYKKERARLIVPFLLPAVIIYTIFFTYPAVQSPYFSLTKWSGIGPTEFVGQANYQQLLTDGTWWNAVKNTLYYATLGGVLGLALGLLFAVTIRSLSLRLGRYAKAIIFAPSTLSVALVAMLWLFIYNPVFGLLNGMLRMVGLEALALPWLGMTSTTIPAITVASVWAGVGSTTILFLAGLQKIPKEFYDAAQIDGANDWQLFRHVTWPLLWEVTRILIILALIGGLQAFGLFYVIAGGFTRPDTDVTGTFLYRAAFNELRFGYATAMGVVLFAIIMVLTIISNRLLTRESVEY
jgi:ABC-type sugar transport system permease subunit